VSRAKSIQVGDEAPPLAAETHIGEQITLAQFRGEKAVVLFFYPKDGTAICTAEACAFRDSYEDFVKAGAVVIGISSDSLASHQRFASERQLPFLLLSDRDGAIRRLFGVPKTLGFLPGRVTYVIDKQGIVRHILNAQLAAARHVTEAMQTVKQLNPGISA
jgi:thioredoxin-dependent peroxiredoxin